MKYALTDEIKIYLNRKRKIVEIQIENKIKISDYRPFVSRAW